MQARSKCTSHSYGSLFLTLWISLCDGVSLLAIIVTHSCLVREVILLFLYDEAQQLLHEDRCWAMMMKEVKVLA